MENTMKIFANILFLSLFSLPYGIAAADTHDDATMDVIEHSSSDHYENEIELPEDNESEDHDNNTNETDDDSADSEDSADSPDSPDDDLEEVDEIDEVDEVDEVHEPEKPEDK